jgi:hypothetical protein
MYVWIDRIFTGIIFAVVGFHWLRRCFTHPRQNTTFVLFGFLIVTLALNLLKFGLIDRLAALDEAFYLLATRWPPSHFLNAARTLIYWAGIC